MTEDHLKNTKSWIAHTGNQLLVTVAGGVIILAIGFLFFSEQNVVFTNAPPNLFNEEYNPFLGKWQNQNAKLYGFTQLIVEKDNDNLVWAELFDECPEANCSIARVRAELTGDILSAHHVSEERTLAMVMRFSGTELIMDLNYSYLTSEGKQSTGIATLGFNKVSSTTH